MDDCCNTATLMVTEGGVGITTLAFQALIIVLGY